MDVLTGIDGIEFRWMKSTDVVGVGLLVANTMTVEHGIVYTHGSTGGLGAKEVSDRVLVGTAGGKVVATCGLHIDDESWPLVPQAWVSWLAVSPDMQRSGAGTKMMDWILAMAKERGFCELYVETYSTAAFKSAREFYLKYGFVHHSDVLDMPIWGTDTIYYRYDVGS